VIAGLSKIGEKPSINPR